MGLAAPRTYIGSRRAEIDHVLRMLTAGNADAGLHLPPPAAGADSLEAEPVHSGSPQVGVLDHGSADADTDAVERERQARLARWQRQP
jgi:hypothetical protein